MRLNDWSGYARSVLRILVGVLFALHGFQKLFGMFGGLGGHGASPLWSESWVAGVIESFGGAAIFLGLYTRPVALLLCGEMAVAYFQKHLPRGFWPIQNAGEVAVLYCFLFGYLCIAGGGPLSLDRTVRHKK